LNKPIPQILHKPLIFALIFIGCMVASVNALATVIYTTPNTFTVGVPITSLTPSGTTTGTTFSITTGLATFNTTGLVFNATTGVISGTPTTAAVAFNIVVRRNGVNSGNISITVLAAPVASFTMSPATINVSATGVTFVNNSTPATGLTYAWDFGDGASTQTSTVKTPALSTTLYWTTPGVKTITLVVTNAAGAQATTTQTITVKLTGTLANYVFTMPLTLNSVSMGLTASLSNFPYLVSISDPSLISSTCNSAVQFPSGPSYDFAFYDPVAGAEAPYQVVKYDPVAGTLLAWVKIGTLSNSANASLSFLYGSSTANTANTPANVWDANYVAVYNFDEAALSAAAGAIADANGSHPATETGMVTGDLTTGKIGNAYKFSTGKKITSIATDATTIGSYTLSAWVNMSSSSSDQKIVTNQSDASGSKNGYKMGITSPTTTPVYAENESVKNGLGGNTRDGTGGTPISAGSWYYVTAVYTSPSVFCYVNGGAAERTFASTAPGAGNVIKIGQEYNNTTAQFNGTIDEVRVSNIARSASWVKAEYLNQNTPATYITQGTITANSTTFKGSILYTWTGAISGDPSLASNWSASATTTNGTLPAFDGTASLEIANTGTVPALTADISLYGLTIDAGASLNLNGHKITVGCNVINSAGGQILYSGNTASAITWSGTTAQTFTTTATSTSETGDMTINNTNGVTFSGGPFDVYDVLTLTAGNLSITAPAVFTLRSLATNTASVAAVPSGYSIIGNVNVQRFLTGTDVKYRSYHLLASPVNVSSKTDGTGNIGLSYINTNQIIGGTTYYGALTAGPGGPTNGFTVSNGNPTLYLYNENLASNNNGFTSGKNVGVVVVGISTVSTVSGSTITANVSIPVGNGFMFYFIGDDHLTTTAATRVPENTTITAVGTINQQNVPVKLWNTGTTALYATNNLVGNPYPSTIDLNKVYSDNTIGQVFYELYNVNPGQPYVSYSTNGTTGTTSSPNASRYIASGQGFFVTATAGQTVTFKEDQKAATVQLTGATLLMSTPAQRVVQTNNTITLPDAVNSAAVFSTQQDNIAPGLHLTMMQDSSVYDDCGIYFFKNGIDKYDSSDALDLDGLSPRVYMSSFTADGKRTGINILGNYAKGKRVKLFVKAIADGVYKLNLTDIQNIDVTNYNLYLKDNYTKDSLDLNHNPSYSFRIQNSDTTSFGANRFELVLTPKPLPPYTLTSFNAKKVNEGVLLTWTTANEGNYTGFTLEKQNGAQFIALNNLQSNGAGTYTYIDHNPTTGTNAYRLMQSGLEANISYSETVSALYRSDLLTIYPNPAKDIINIYVNVPTTDSTPSYQMSIYDPSGTLILTKQISKTYTQAVGTLRLGTYIVQITDNNGKLIGNTKFSKIQ
jgi:hypothetical protein